MGLSKDDETVAGVIYVSDPSDSDKGLNGNLYWADSKGAWKTKISTANGKFVEEKTVQLSADTRNPQIKSTFTLGDFLDVHPDAESRAELQEYVAQKRAAYIEKLRKSQPHLGNIEKTTSVCADMMAVADGRSSGYAHAGHWRWDTAAAELILKKAGIPFVQWEFDHCGELRNALAASPFPTVAQTCQNIYQEMYPEQAVCRSVYVSNPLVNSKGKSHQNPAER